MNVSVREAVAADWPAMLDVWTRAWTALLPDLDFEARRDWFTQHIRALQRDGAAILVAVDADESVQAFLTIDPQKAEVDQLVTAVGAQRQGLGRRLLGLAKGRSPRGLSLTVNLLNTRAIALYESEGFVVVGAGVSARSGLPVQHMRWPGLPQRGYDEPEASTIAHPLR